MSSTDGDKSKSTNVVITTDGQTESVTLQYPTTAGISDSKLARTYSSPKED